MKKALITGISGFAASHLTDLLLEKGYEVHGTSRLHDDTSNIEHIKNNIEIHWLDILDKYNVDEVIKRVMPDIIFHLAAQSFVGYSWEAPALTIETNVMGTLNIVEAVRRNCPKSIVHIASSSQIYGKVEKFPMTIDTPFNPMSTYDVSKLAQEMIARQYHTSYGLDVRITRAFNITGARRAPFFAECTFSEQIAKIEKGIQEPIIKVGNLDSARDYIDVKDAVRGYLLSVEKGTPGGIYILCSGIATKMNKILSMLLSLSEVKDIKIEQDPKRMRPSDTPKMFGDYFPTKLDLGWEPTVPLKKTLEDVLNYYRERV